ncbi:MAG: hypothetical protein CR967_04635 [Proteobacteria bacterium]|nr:MAG: hypothetical protein CR967_04635 [Pseudomonadota bacterium]
MSWFNNYRPLTSGTEVAEQIRKNGNAFTALGAGLAGIGNQMTEKIEKDKKDQILKMKKAFNQARLDEINQKKTDDNYLAQVYSRPNKLSFEKNYDGSLKPSASAIAKANEYWANQDKKLELAGAWVDAEDDKDTTKEWNKYKLNNPKGTFGDFAKSNPNLIEDTTPETLTKLRGAYEDNVKNNMLDALKMKQAKIDIKNAQLTNKEKQLQIKKAEKGDKTKDKKDVSSSIFLRLGKEINGKGVGEFTLKGSAEDVQTANEIEYIYNNTNLTPIQAANFVKEKREKEKKEDIKKLNLAEEAKKNLRSNNIFANTLGNISSY